MSALTMEGFEKLNPFYKKKQNMSTKLTVMAGTYWGSRSCCIFSEVNAALEEKDKEISKLKEAQRWRMFSEEKPEHHQYILVFMNNGRTATCNIELRRWDDGCKFDVEMQELYTHWMPLPKEPEA